MQSTVGAGTFRYVEEDLLKFLQRSLAEPVACRHSGLCLDAFPQSLHGGWPICHTAVPDFLQSRVSELAEVGSCTVQERRWDPVPLFVAQPLVDPLFKKPSVLCFLKQAQAVANHFAGGSVASPRDQPFDEGVLSGR